MANALKGLDDFTRALFMPSLLGFVLGLGDIKQRYRRSKIGPFWITLSMSVTIGGMGAIFATIFGTPLENYLPFLCAGMVIWTLLSTTISDACNVFTSSENIIKQIKLPFHVYVIRLVWRNLIIFAHNLLIFPIICLLFEVPYSVALLFSIIGMILVLLNLIWIAVLIGVICTRYRDVSQIVFSVLQLWFFVTPIIWKPELMEEKGRVAVLLLNPFYHLIEMIRAPLLGNMPSGFSIIFVVAMLVLGSSFSFMLLGKYKDRLAYWL